MMGCRQFTVAALVLSLAAQAASVVAAPRSSRLFGNAKDEARQPYTDFTIQARELEHGLIASSVPLDLFGNFALTGLRPASYIVELLDRTGNIVCADGPYEVRPMTVDEQSDVRVELHCGHIPAVWWLLSAASAAGVTAGITSGTPASPSK
jgi:hypothetical protein